MGDEWLRAVVTVGKGRGFVIKVKGRRYIITAGHCLRHYARAHAASYTEERTYPRLLGPLGAKPTVWCECLFVDPIADLAVLDSPDGQALSDEADQYEALVNKARPLRIGRLRYARERRVMSDGRVFYGRPHAQSPAWLFSLDQRRIPCTVRSGGGSVWIERAAEPVQGGMSGSPIIAGNGLAIGAISTGTGLNPGLPAHLPFWFCQGAAFPLVEAAIKPAG